jgi:hypothetical protein
MGCLGSKVDHTSGAVSSSCCSTADAYPSAHDVSPSYVVSVALKKLFLFKCNLPILRLTPMLALLFLPPVMSKLLAFHQRAHPRRLLSPSMDAVTIACFPIAWFYGFLYYTEVPSLLLVVATVAAATQGRHWLAGLVRFQRTVLIN